ncbi:MAG: type IV toxin-antitoxin system AbiEi family antitoxin domain-containing protein [Phenylobacterium sp.]|nr:type IV toxin-antitoxin system AbiEi family antitoxin domain-containing protein [Phenylobacterium sp.]
MAKLSDSKLNHLLAQLPEGLLVDAAWLTERGYSTSLRSHYVSAGWLEQPAPRVYRRPRGTIRWEQVVISLQTLLKKPYLIGGRTSLELQGFSHYLASEIREVHLYGPKPLPGWVHALPLPVRFCQHNSQRLFRNDGMIPGPALDMQTKAASNHPIHASARSLAWGQFEWSLTVSTPERAILEMIDELPKRESFHQVDMFMESLSTLSPKRLTTLLHACSSVKVKRLFFFFAFRHDHRWRRQLDPKAFDLGTGKRMLAPGGRLDPRFQITVPEDFDGQP